jgi:hypothetical protein
VVKARVTSLIRGLQVQILPVRKATVAQFGRATECTVVRNKFPGIKVGESRVFRGKRMAWRGLTSIRRLAGNYELSFKALIIGPRKNLSRMEQDRLTTLLLYSSFTLEQISSVVENASFIACPQVRVDLSPRAIAVDRLNSRRHLECRSFKLESRTITLHSIVPCVGFVSSVGCLHFAGGEDKSYFGTWRWGSSPCCRLLRHSSVAERQVNRTLADLFPGRNLFRRW